MKIKPSRAPEESLQERVLLYLQGRDLVTWGEMYLHFDDGGTGDIGAVLRVLEKVKQIELKKNGTVKITNAGLERLSHGRSPLNMREISGRHSFPSRTSRDIEGRSWPPGRSFQERVLVYLTEKGPKKFATVYAHFAEDATAEIGPVLGILASLQQIRIDDKGYVKITQAGFERISTRR